MKLVKIISIILSMIVIVSSIGGCSEKPPVETPPESTDIKIEVSEHADENWADNLLFESWDELRAWVDAVLPDCAPEELYTNYLNYHKGCGQVDGRHCYLRYLLASYIAGYSDNSTERYKRFYPMLKDGVDADFVIGLGVRDSSIFTLSVRYEIDDYSYRFLYNFTGEGMQGVHGDVIVEDVAVGEWLIDFCDEEYGEKTRLSGRFFDYDLGMGVRITVTNNEGYSKVDVSKLALDSFEYKGLYE